MKTLPARLLAAALCAVAVASATPCSAQRREIGAAVADDRRRAGAPADDALLARAEAAVAADRPLAALFYLQARRTDAGAAAYVAARAKGAADAAGFERAWRAAGRELAAKERARDAARPRLPRAGAALADVSREQVRPYYEGGRLYGASTTFENGLYYVGLAEANLDFVRFCRTLPFPPVETGPALVPLEPELDRLDADVVAAYGRADADARAAFVPVSADLELARDLEAHGRREAALAKYLYAALLFRSVGAPPADEARLAAARETLAAERARLATSPGDQSVGLLFVELAEGALDRARGGEARAGVTAVALADDVLPRYFDYVSRLGR